MVVFLSVLNSNFLWCHLGCLLPVSGCPLASALLHVYTLCGVTRRSSYDALAAYQLYSQAHCVRGLRLCEEFADSNLKDILLFKSVVHALSVVHKMCSGSCAPAS